MESPLFFYQRTLIALVWLCLMLPWAWPSAPAAGCPTAPEPTPPRPKRHRAPTPFAGFPQKPHCAACEPPPAPRPPLQLRHHASCPRGGAAARSPPRCTSARTRPVGTRAGSAGARSAPMALPMAVPGGSYGGSLVAAPFWRPSARACLASAPPGSSACGWWRAWPKAWASGARRAGARAPRTRCCSGWGRQQSSCRPSHSTACLTCGSAGAVGRTLCAPQCGQGRPGQRG
jgi:hypothetical protein